LLSWCAASCVAPLGPGYTIEKQQIQVHFVAAPEPRIRIEADYLLKNTGNQPLSDLELRLPGRRRFHYDEPRATWDGATLAIGTSEDNPRNPSLPSRMRGRFRRAIRCIFPTSLSLLGRAKRL